MRLVKSLVVIFLFIFSAVTAQSDPEFQKNFKKVKTIKLEEKVPIKIVLQLDVDKEGNLLVSDNPKTYLFNPEGKLIKELNSDECSPGVKWLIPRAVYRQNGEIVKYSFTAGVLFSNRGVCIKKLDASFMSPLFLSSFSDGSLISYIPIKQSGMSLFSTFNKDGKASGKFGTHVDGMNNASTQITFKGGFVVDSKDVVYQAHFNDAHINKFDKNGKWLGQIFKKPDRYVTLTEDMPKIDFSKYNINDKASRKELEDKYEKYYTDYTYVSSLFMLDTELLMLRYNYKEEDGLQIFTREGKYLLEKDIKIDKKQDLILSKNGYVYLIIRPDIKKNPDILNPSIEVYKYIGKRN